MKLSAIIPPVVSTRFVQLSFVPFLVLVALMTMYVRASNVVTAVEEGKVAALFSPASAVAQSVPTADKNEQPVTANPETPEAVEAGVTEARVETAETAPSAPSVMPSRDTGGAVDALSDEDLQVLQQLAQRRTELDRRGRELDNREALIQAAEKRLEEKVGQLQQSRAELEKLLGQANDQQAGQVRSLVKIYETMKPKQAAAIFEQLDMSVLLKVVQEMKEAKAAPIIAEMDTMRAKSLTTELMRRRDLPKNVPNVN